MYRVTEYIGDYPLECQEHWRGEFSSSIRAWSVAKAIWEEAVITTKVVNSDYYVLIEKEDSNDDAGWAAIGAFNISGPEPYEYIKKSDIKKFISYFERM